MPATLLNGGRATLADRLYKPGSGARGLVYAPGGGGTELSFLDPTIPGVYPVSKAIAESGVPIVSFATGWGWGGDANQTDLGSAGTWGQAAQLGMSAGRVHLLGGSMGGAIALNWAKAHLDQVQSITLIIPAVDIQDICDNNRGGYSASIAAIYGGRPPDDHTPARNAAAFAAAAVPIQVFYSTNDPICVPATVEQFCAAAGANLTSLGAIGHSGAGVDPVQVVRFLREHS